MGIDFESIQVAQIIRSLLRLTAAMVCLSVAVPDLESGL